MSGKSLRVMILRVLSMVTVVLNGGNSSNLCQPSSKAVRATARNGRTRSTARRAHDGAPLRPPPRRQPEQRGRRQRTRPYVVIVRARLEKSPAGAVGFGKEGWGAGGRLTTATGRAMETPTPGYEQNKNIVRRALAQGRQAPILEKKAPPSPEKRRFGGSHDQIDRRRDAIVSSSGDWVRCAGRTVVRLLRCINVQLLLPQLRAVPGHCPWCRRVVPAKFLRGFERPSPADRHAGT